MIAFRIEASLDVGPDVVPQIEVSRVEAASRVEVSCEYLLEVSKALVGNHQPPQYESWPSNLEAIFRKASRGKNSVNRRY